MKFFLIFALILGVYPQDVTRGIQKRIDGLIFISEIDSEVEFYQGDVPPGEILDFDDYFATKVAADPNWAELTVYMRANLHDINVYKVGTIQVDVYAVGFSGKRAIGIHFKTVET